MEIFWHAIRSTSWSSVNKIRVPTLLITGSADRMTPPNRSEYLRDQIERADLQIVEGVGHMVMIERPDEVADLLTGFLDQIPYNNVRKFRSEWEWLSAALDHDGSGDFFRPFPVRPWFYLDLQTENGIVTKAARSAFLRDDFTGTNPFDSPYALLGLAIATVARNLAVHGRGIPLSSCSR